MDNPPEKRMREIDGKQYTPPCFLLQFQDGSLFFVMEDIVETAVKMNGVVIRYNEFFVQFAEVVGAA